MESSLARPHGKHRSRLALLAMIVLFALGADAPRPNPFAQFDLPNDWQTRYWAGADVKALFALDPKAVADLVPTQAGVRFCRCPACDAVETDDPLTWSPVKPKVVTCKKCGVAVPNDKFPAKEEKKDDPPSDTVEVLPGVTHTYPYHLVPAEHQRYPDERLYLAARRDDAAREFLAKAALYAAVRHRQRPDPAVARVAAVILLRFAQVYPAYATHYDQPSSLKFFNRADAPPPYRRGYGTGKWCWSGAQDVPLNLLIAFALLRDDAALAEAGKLLKEPTPARRIEDDLFRASARFVARQPEETGTPALQAIRGLLAIGRLLNDPKIVNEAVVRLDRFAAREFAYDGFSNEGKSAAHRRLLDQLDGWFDRLLPSEALPPTLASVRGRGVPEVAGAPPVLSLARTAAAAPLSEERGDPVRLVSWSTSTAPRAPRTPAFLGGTGLARLAVGAGDDALDLELRGLDASGPDRICRQALRLAVGGKIVLGDLDETDGTPSGFEHASVSRNTVVVNGLNQRESYERAVRPVPSGDFFFFAADPDFQVAALDDPRSYPQSTTRYRQTVIASAGPNARYAVSVFEVHGGTQHDQLFHGAVGAGTRWALAEPLARGPQTLLPSKVPFIPQAQGDEGRWFLQSFGEIQPREAAALTRPTRAWLTRSVGGPAPAVVPTGVRLHLLTDAPMTAITAVSPDPSSTTGPAAGLGTLVLRRKSFDGTTLRTTFVTVFEPIGSGIRPLNRVGRVGQGEEGDNVVVIALDTADGIEHLVINLDPNNTARARLTDGRIVATDGLAVRVSATGVVLAGGTFVDTPGALPSRQRLAVGRIRGAYRTREGDSLGWFESDTRVPDPEALAGRILLVRHGDGATRGWTLVRVENTGRGARLLVREDPGFQVDPNTGAARYDRGPRPEFPGPHAYWVSRISRTSRSRP